MFTLLLAWINSVYSANYTWLFLGTFLIDLSAMNVIGHLILCKMKER